MNAPEKQPSMQLCISARQELSLTFRVPGIDARAGCSCKKVTAPRSGLVLEEPANRGGLQTVGCMIVAVTIMRYQGPMSDSSRCVP